ncbi:hypothetical protein Taro_031269 [Colocasia esculenta]|uniref:Tyrosyl-tRNA synthetase n=1 Tax=Colocasia esculenta TaxID=4460 RepID=A0A843VIG9_COLES|nr:hypothetical protein [Colocasia esculenta]
MGVNVQSSGSDQWANITAGTELISRILQAEGVYGLTFPLLLKSDGTKFGKSENADVVRFLKILTFLGMEETRELEKGMGMLGYVPNTAQRRLTEEVTHFVHGEEGLEEALKATEALRPGAERELNSETIKGIAEDVPSCSLQYGEVLGSSLVDLSVSSGLLSSKSAARRLELLLSAGKKNKMVIGGSDWWLKYFTDRLTGESNLVSHRGWALRWAMGFSSKKHQRWPISNMEQQRWRCDRHQAGIAS